MEKWCFVLPISPKFRYPDVMVTCEPLDNTDLAANSAILLIEVLSSSTVKTDRVEKLEEYATVEGLETYLIVDPAVCSISLYRRQSGAFVLGNAGDELDLGHGLSVTLDKIYRGVLWEIGTRPVRACSPAS